MNNLSSHRGPDGEGYFKGSNFAFGHRRLAIVDYKNAMQPMLSDGYAIVFNGEIYNFREIKSMLEKQNVQFNTESDTEVLLKAYILWGTKCVQKLDGMWSFLIYDPKQNIIFGSRDRFGMKPFYYSIDDSGCYIASEIKQLLPFLPPQEGNTEMIMDYLFGSLEEHSNQTFFKNIFKLQPGFHFIYDLKNHQYKTEKYYHLNISTPSDMAKTGAIYNHIYKSVNLRIQTEVKTGIMLSGGLDSAVLAACMENKTVSAIHATGSGEKNEQPFAENVANHLSLPLDYFTPFITDWKKEMDEVIYVQEEPFGSPSVIMQYKLMQYAHKKGFKVLVDGQGADEIFLGYRPYFFKMLQSKSLFEKIIMIKSNYIFISKNWIKTIFYYMFYANDGLKKLYYIRHKNFIHRSIYKYFMPDKYIQKSGSGQNLKQWQVNEIQNTQLPGLLRYEDKNAMSQGIETRLPYLDHHLVETAVHLPDHMKINKDGTKYTLRKAFEALLPKEIVWRKDKTGFEAPHQWVLDHHKEITEEIMNSIFLPLIIKQKYLSTHINNSLRWRMFCLSRWASVFNITKIYT